MNFESIKEKALAGDDPLSLEEGVWLYESADLLELGLLATVVALPLLLEMLNKFPPNSTSP